MGQCRIHITGASGSGTTTLGRSLAQVLGVPHHDIDDYFWLPTSPPYQQARPPEDRLRLMQEIFVPLDRWVLSGSVSGWGESLTPMFDMVVFLTTSTPVRMRRLEDRERRRYGETALLPGGSRYAATIAFFDWARQYDDPNFNGRSRAKHEAWLASVRCPVVRFDGEQPVEVLLDAVTRRLPQA
jgi:adenylate kinase family enzyme